MDEDRTGHQNYEPGHDNGRAQGFFSLKIYGRTQVIFSLKIYGRTQLFLQKRSLWLERLHPGWERAERQERVWCSGQERPYVPVPTCSFGVAEIVARW
jgi:hypothetical protein